MFSKPLSLQYVLRRLVSPPIFTSLFLLLSCPAGLFAQPGIGFGISTSYDFDVDLGRLPGYTPYGKGRTSLVSFDASLRLPLVKSGYINIYPTFIYSIPARISTVSNDDGDYLPDGYVKQLPFDANGPDVVYSGLYHDLSSHAEVWQKSYGSFLTFGKSFQAGTGLFLRNKRTDYYSTLLRDEYWYGDSEGTTWDNYYYEDTQYVRTTCESKTERLLMMPLIAKYNLTYNWWYTSGSFIYWAGKDNFLSFRYTVGINF